MVLGFGVIWWSIATILTPIAAKLGLPFLLVVRAFMGVGEVCAQSLTCYISLGLCVADKGEELRSILSLVSSGCCDACYEQYTIQVGACAREKQIPRACLQRNVPWIRHRFGIFAFLDSSVWLAFRVLLFWVAWNCVVDSLAN